MMPEWEGVLVTIRNVRLADMENTTHKPEQDVHPYCKLGRVVGVIPSRFGFPVPEPAFPWNSIKR